MYVCTYAKSRDYTFIIYGSLNLIPCFLTFCSTEIKFLNFILVYILRMNDTYRYTDNIDTNITIAITILYFVYCDNY